MALIRWLGGNVLYLAHFSNIVLLGSFLGIGLGFLVAKCSDGQILKFAPLALFALVVFVWTLWPQQIIDGALLMIPVLILLVTWGIEFCDDQVLWTPYYKANYVVGDGGAGVLVNGVPH